METPTQNDPPVALHRLVRASFARGRKYQFFGYPTWIKINAVSFRGHPDDDGGMQGVSVTWWNSTRKRMFYPCRNEEEFWAMEIFRNAFDCPNALGEARADSATLPQDQTL